MQWVKNQPTVAYPLVVSGMLFCPRSLLPLPPEAIEVNGPSTYGHPPLREAVARHSGVGTDSVVLAEGTSMANHLVMAACLEPGDEVLIEDPTYELLVCLAGYLGAAVRRFPRPRDLAFMPDLAALRRQVTSHTRLIVLTQLHNPSSAQMPESLLWEVGEIAAGAGARVLVDEVYLETVAPSVPSSAFHLGDPFVTTNSLTKVYGLNGLRCGWVLAEPALARRMWELNDLFGVIPSHPSEQLGVAAFAAIDRLRERTWTHLGTNREWVRRALCGHPALDLLMPGHGTVVFPRLRTGNVDAFCEQLRTQHDTTVVPGRFFGMPDHFRLGFGGRTEILQEGLKRLLCALEA